MFWNFRSVLIVNIFCVTLYYDQLLRTNRHLNPFCWDVCIENFVPIKKKLSKISIYLQFTTSLRTACNKMTGIVLLQMFSHDIWRPLFEPALIAFPKWKYFHMRTFYIWNSVMSILLIIPISATIEKYGILKTKTIYTCCNNIYYAAPTSWLTLCLHLYKIS